VAARVQKATADREKKNWDRQLSSAKAQSAELEAELLLKKEEMEALGKETTKLRTEVQQYNNIFTRNLYYSDSVVL